MARSRAQAVAALAALACQPASAAAAAARGSLRGHAPTGGLRALLGAGAGAGAGAVGSAGGGAALALGAPSSWALSSAWGSGGLQAALQAARGWQSRRAMGTALRDVPAATVAKARRLAVAVGALAGGFGSLVGVGGGVLISPIIANACKALPQRVISGTSLAAVATTGAAAGWVFARNGAVDATSAAVIAACAVVLAPLGARTAHLVNCASLRTMMGYWLLFVAPLVPLKNFLLKGRDADADAAQPQPAAPDGGAAAGGSPAAGGGGGASTAVAYGGSESSMWRPLAQGDLLLAATGGVAGFASGLLGIGGGTIVTPALAIATGMPQVCVLGTSLAAMVVPSLVGLAQHARLGNVDWLMAAGMAGGTLVGGTLGGNVALGLPDWLLQWAFCGGMLLLGWRTLAGANATRAAAAAAAAAVAGTPAAAPVVAGAAPAAGAAAAAGIKAAASAAPLVPRV